MAEVAAEGVPLFESVPDPLVVGVGADDSVAAADELAVPVPVPEPVPVAVAEIVEEKDAETVTAAVPDADAPEDSVGDTAAVTELVAVLVPVPVPVKVVDGDGDALDEREVDAEVLSDGEGEPLHRSVVAKHWMRMRVICE